MPQSHPKPGARADRRIGQAHHLGYFLPMRLIHRQSACLAMVLATLSLLSIPDMARSADTASTPGTAPRVINVTPDSEKGWIPSVQLENQARTAATDYMADLDNGKYAQAYSSMADLNRKDQSPSIFADRVRQFNERAGPVVERRIVTVTWTKNPAQAPLPGVYAALDLVSRFANIDRHCGYLVLYQAPSGGAFQVMREENNFMDNSTAAGIAKQSSPTAVDRTWATLSAHCPGYQPAPPAPLPEDPSSSIGYPTVDAALAALHANPDVVFREQAGWTIAEDNKTFTTWSFPPPGHPAYPAAVRRQLVQENGAVNMDMKVHCQASKKACDDLVRSFEEMNAQIAASMRRKN